MENPYVPLGIRRIKEKGGFDNTPNNDYHFSMNNQEEWCHYSDLPSPMAYVDNTDYDGMGIKVDSLKTN